jgi:alanyl-tRNA synthetase
LASKHVDTGMGLERIVGVLQGVRSNYDTDLFVPLIGRIQKLLGTTDAQRDERIVSYRVIADHVRALTFLVGDGVLPANEGRGYVLRLILRRAARHGRQLGFERPFLHEVAQTVIAMMGAHYGELRQREDFILMTIQQEESRFSQTLISGLALLDEIIAGLEARGQTTIPGADVFRLYDTHGFPLDLTWDVAREHNLAVDLESYRTAMEEQRERARAGAQFGVVASADAQVYLDVLQALKETGLVPASGVRHLYSDELGLKSVLAALLSGGKSVSGARPGDRVEVVLPETPFYLESGGQVSDTGTITAGFGIDGKPAWTIKIDEIRRPVPGLMVHSGQVIDGFPQVGQEAMAQVDVQRRLDITRNHTATHLLDHELRSILGKHVQQAGSIVAPERLRFDFTHPNALSDEQLDEVERSVNAAILADQPVRAEQTSYRQAVADGAIALFTEKYGEEVRVIKIGTPGEELSRELCGGTHVHRTGQIGVFYILSEESVGAGVRRIEAVTGRAAQELIRRRIHLLDRAAALLHVPVESIGEAVQNLSAELQVAHKENTRLRTELALQEAGDLARGATRVRDVAVVAAEVSDADAQTLRDMSDRIRDMLGTSVVVLATVVDGKPQMIAAVTEDLVERGLHAGALVKAIAKIVGGGGGGKAALAQAGGRDPEKLPAALAAVPGLVAEQLAGS